jgi:hypothetical protein
MVYNSGPRLAIEIPIEGYEAKDIRARLGQIAEIYTKHSLEADKPEQIPKLDRYNTLKREIFPKLVIHTVASRDNENEDNFDLAFTVDHKGCHPSKDISAREYFKEYGLRPPRLLEPNENKVQYGLIGRDSEYSIAVLNHINYSILSGETATQSLFNWLLSGRYGIYTDMAKINFGSNANKHLEEILGLEYPLKNGFYGFNEEGKIYSLENQNKLPGGEFIVGQGKLKTILNQ